MDDLALFAHELNKCSLYLDIAQDYNIPFLMSVISVDNLVNKKVEYQ